MSGRHTALEPRPAAPSGPHPTGARGRRRAVRPAEGHWWERAGRPVLTASTAVALVSLGLAWWTSAGVGAGAQWLPAPLRAALVVLAATVLPGAPVAVLLRLPSRAVSAALAVAVSLCTTIVVAEVSIAATWWHPARAQTLVVLLSLAITPAAGRGLLAPARRARLAAPRAVHPGRGASLASLAAVLALFAVQVRTLDVDGSGALGILPQVGVPYLAALAVLAVVLATALRRPVVDPVVMTAATLVLVTVTTTLVSLADGAASVGTAWVHRGFIALLAQDGALPPGVDARFSWAGFFAAGAHLTTVGGLADARPLMTATPVWVGALMVLPLFVIGRAVTGSDRGAWVGVVVHALANWYQQDYFAPQAVALLLHSTVLATLLWLLRAAPPPVVTGTWWQRLRALPRRTAGVPPGAGPGRTLALEALLLLVLATTVVTHQITPLVAIASTAALALTGSTRYRTLWLATGAVFVGWFTYGASDFWVGHLPGVLADVGQVRASVEGGVSERVGADPVYRLAQLARVATSGLVGLTALVGWWLLRRERSWPVLGLLAAVPFGLVLVQSYGGEVVIRCFVLASPVLAPLAAVAVLRLLPRGRAPGVLGTGALALAVLVASVALTGTRGLNASFERSPAAEVALAERLVAAVPDGTRVLTWGSTPSLVSARLLRVSTGTFPAEPERCFAAPAQCTLELRPEYVLVTSGHGAQLVLQHGAPPTWTEDGVAELTASGAYAEQERTATAVLLRRADVPAAQGLAEGGAP